MNRIFVYLCIVLFQFPVFGQSQLITGYCSFYADKFQGRNTAGGDHYDKNAYTAAHRTLPFNTILEVTNLRNNNKVLVRVNDRGPMARSRILDVSKAAAVQLDMLLHGVEKVSIKILDSATSAFLLDTLTNARLDVSSIKAHHHSTDKTPAVEMKNRQVYDKDLKLCQPTGYGVQTGYYQIRKNCLNDMAMYEKMYSAPAYLIVDKKSQNTYYRLIMGSFESKPEAETLRQRIMKKIPGCFIMEWWKI